MLQSEKSPEVVPKKRLLDKIRTKVIQKNEWQLYLLILPVVIYFLVFNYAPIYGVIIAFKRYSISQGIWESPWVGLLYFERFFNSPMFLKLLSNTLLVSFYQLIVFFPIPVIFALMLNHLTSKRFKQIAQTITFAPHFISMVVLVGMMFLFFSPVSGVFNIILRNFGFEPINFMGSSQLFRHIFVFSHVWQHTGYFAIIYLAALTGVDVNLYEAASIDGASKLHKIWYIDLPTIIPTVVTMLLLQVGKMMYVDTYKALLMQTPTNLDTSEIIGTYVYKVGLINAQFSYSTAIDLFQNLVNLALLISVNHISKKLAKESLW